MVTYWRMPNFIKRDPKMRPSERIVHRQTRAGKYNGPWFYRKDRIKHILPFTVEVIIY